MRTLLRLLVIALATATLGSTATFGALTVGASALDGASLPPAAARTLASVAEPPYALPSGLTLPHGTRAIARATASSGDHGIKRWEVRLDLGDTTGAQALDLLASQLERANWHIERGSQDLFAARLTKGRWEIVVARWPAPLMESPHTIGVGIGSRPE